MVTAKEAPETLFQLILNRYDPTGDTVTFAGVGTWVVAHEYGDHGDWPLLFLAAMVTHM